MADILTFHEPNDVDTYMKFQKYLAAMIGKEARILALFHGEGWCPDCPPAIQALESIATRYEEYHFLSVYVGDRPQWKRTVLDGDERIRDNRFMLWQPHLQAVPTVVLYVCSPEHSLALRKATLVTDSPNYRVHWAALDDLLTASERA